MNFLHTESVIHDDIIDNETMRRQKRSVSISKYGYNASILTGDFVLGLILATYHQDSTIQELLRIFPTTAMLMSEGEIIEGRLEELVKMLPLHDYLKVIEYKTANSF